MRLTAKRVRDAHEGCKKTIQLAFRSTDAELLSWAKKIMPILQEGERVDLLRLIVEDVLDRSLDPLHVENYHAK